MKRLILTAMKKHIRTSVFSLMIVTMSVLLSAGHLYAANNSLSFNGSSSYVDCGDAPFQSLNGTWEAWFYVSSFSITLRPQLLPDIRCSITI